MKKPNLVSTAFVLTLLVVAALLSSSCDSGDGLGMGVGAPTRWGGGSSGGSGPPIFVGGPSF